MAKILFAGVMIAYPFVVLFGLAHFEPRIVALIVAAIALCRLALGRSLQGSKMGSPQLTAVVAAMLLSSVVAMASNSTLVLKCYPVCMNALMLTLFGVSLLRPPTVIERIARITTPDLPEAGVRYTRKVTMVWCGFFVFNFAMSAWTVAVPDMRFWAVYNGFVSYGLMGLLFAGEYLVRRNLRQREAAHHGSRSWS